MNDVPVPVHPISSKSLQHEDPVHPWTTPWRWKYSCSKWGLCALQVKVHNTWACCSSRRTCRTDSTIHLVPSKGHKKEMFYGLKTHLRVFEEFQKIPNSCFKAGLNAELLLRTSENIVFSRLLCLLVISYLRHCLVFVLHIHIFPV